MALITTKDAQIKVIKNNNNKDPSLVELTVTGAAGRPALERIVPCTLRGRHGTNVYAMYTNMFYIARVRGDAPRMQDGRFRHVRGSVRGSLRRVRGSVRGSLRRVRGSVRGTPCQRLALAQLSPCLFPFARSY